MIIPQTTNLLKRAADLTGIPAKAILRTKRNARVNAARAAIWQILQELGHNRQRISEAFGCDFKTIQWGLDHPSSASRKLACDLRTIADPGIIAGHHDCGSGIGYGICPQCQRGHGYIIRINSVPQSMSSTAR